ncbi:hypothetical protein [Arthrobacter livingstonensis]|uniref:hypothetical protein n=1 Tax=Arthrobacter livingstonensis TaxID=670078 RepID=UPI0014732E7E|nr:hypothetical protein [Arthrobacter livingstonensis]
MSAPHQLRVGILVGQVSHPQAVIDDLWHRATGAAPAGWQVQVEVVHVGTRPDSAQPAGGVQGIVQLQPPTPFRGSARLSALAGGQGPAGVVGRLVRDNLESRRVAVTLARRKDLVASLRGSAVVVAADPSADRAVWQLRKLTGAHLVHGPAAMVHAIKVLSDS